MKIHFSLIIVLIFALYTGTIIEFGIFFGCIILHELGHLFFIVLFKQKVDKINLTIFGGQIDCYIGNISFIRSILINSGGIIVNIIILNFSNSIEGYYRNVIYNYNFLLIIFNLLPIYPLDGYRIIESFLMNASVGLAYSILSVLSIIMIIGLSIYGIILHSLGIIIIAVFLLQKNIDRIKNRDKIVLRKFIKRYSKN